jgi:putative nucleotidyltransferase with HDIG domain
MFVHLDLGWMRHPFPLSSFRIGSPEQIETIRALGVEEVRWIPERSDPAVLQPVEAPLPSLLPPSPPAAPARAPKIDAAAERRAALAAQRAAQLLVERQYAEAAAALRQASRAARHHPAQARADAEALSRALVDKLLVDGEMCIRLLSSSAGDRAAAHGMNVAVISLLMGRSFGLSADDMLDLGVGAMLHDLGKGDLPDRVRHLSEGFTPAEASAYRSHVAHGVALGRKMGLADGALAVVAQHHERADGTGFPQQLRADRMSLGARIVALVNRYDNLCNPAVLAPVLTPHEAVSLLFAQDHGRFDATILNAFIRMMGVYPAGSVVQLTDDRFAMVMAVNSTRPLRPRVLVHDTQVPRDEALIVDLELTPGLGIRRSLVPAKLPPGALEYLAPHPRVAYFFEPAPSRPPEEEA